MENYVTELNQEEFLKEVEFNTETLHYLLALIHLNEEKLSKCSPLEQEKYKAKIDSLIDEIKQCNRCIEFALIRFGKGDEEDY